MTNGFKIFWSQDWLKVCDISILEYKRDKIDANGNLILAFDSNNQPIYKTDYDGKKFKIDPITGQKIQDTVKESKGWRVKLEFTDDGWKTKKIIYLQDEEISDFIAVILGKRDKWYFARENKNINIEFQGEHSFLKFTQKDNEINKIYAVKIDKFSGLRIITLWLIALQYEFKRVMWVTIDTKTLLSSIIELYSKEKINSIIPTQTTTSNWVVQIQTVNTPTSNLPVCSSCGKSFDIPKESKVIEFSINKFGKPVCYKCQKNYI